MVQLVFNVNERFLAGYVIANFGARRFVGYANEQTKRDIINFQNLAWDTSPDLCTIIDGRNPIYLQAHLSGEKFDQIGSELETYLHKLIGSKEFITLKKQTEQSLIEIKDEWEQNFKETSDYIKKLGIGIRGKFNINIVHPGLKAGRFIPPNNVIWSHQTYWTNYNTVYLWHEILHSYFGKSEEEHALIELITDQEMRYRLNKTEYPPMEGHDYIKEIKLNMLPSWKNYLKANNSDINKLVEDLKKT
jgi:hypothetical protein